MYNGEDTCRAKQRQVKLIIKKYHHIKKCMAQKIILYDLDILKTNLKKMNTTLVSLRLKCSPDIFIRNSSDALWYIIHSNLIQNIKWPKTKLLLLSYTNDLFYIVKYYLPFKWIIFKNAKKYLNSHFFFKSFKSYRFYNSGGLEHRIPIRRKS